MGSRAKAGKGKAEQGTALIVRMPSSRWTWTRPTTHIYSYNREAQNVLSSRSARATSVAANESKSTLTSTSESNLRSSRASSVAASTDSFTGYSGYYGRQMALIMQKQGPTAAAAAVPISESLRAGSPAPTIYPKKAATSASATTASASRSTAISTKETTTTETKLTREQVLKAQSESIEYGKRSKSQALRRAESQGIQFYQGALVMIFAKWSRTCTSLRMRRRRSTLQRHLTLRAGSRLTGWRNSCSM